MSLYTGLASTATRLLTQFGVACTLTRTTGAGSSSEQSGYAVRDQINEGDRRNLAGAAGVAPIDARKYILSPALAPEMGDRLDVGSDSSMIERVDVIKPGATVLAWQVLAVAA